LLHQSAILLEEDEQTEAAISLFHDLGDWVSMIQLIKKQGPSMLAQGRYRTFGEWLDSVYRGSFLFGEIEEPWVILMRKRLRNKFLRSVKWLGHYWEQAKEYEKALETYQRGLEGDSEMKQTSIPSLQRSQD